MFFIAPVKQAASRVPTAAVSLGIAHSSPEFLIGNITEPGRIFIAGSMALKAYRKEDWRREKHAVPARRT